MRYKLDKMLKTNWLFFQNVHNFFEFFSCAFYYFTFNILNMLFKFFILQLKFLTYFEITDDFFLSFL